MTAPEPTGEHTPPLAERVARARHVATFEKRGWMPWDDAPSPYRSDALRQAEEHLVAIEAAGLAVVELPEPDGRVDAVNDNGEDVLTPYWKTSWGESVTAWIEGVETPVRELREDLDAISADAAKMLAAIAACKRFRAQRQGGDPR